ncbi:MAG: hypothetical protein H6581_13720 [Bacteroidia bacterium]|nr:hypothetical protein [Bacteroidia bacterium]
MIVFNIPAVIVAALIGLVYWLVSLLIPDSWLNTDGNNVFLMLIIGTIVSVISETVGLKGRLFWLPMWLFGLLGTGFVSYGKWGWIGPVGMVVIGAGIFGGLILLSRRVEKKEWENAPNALAELQRQFSLGTNTPDFWQAMKTAFFQPSFMKNTPEVCQHNLIVIDVLKESGEWNEESSAAIEKYRTLVESGVISQAPVKIPSEVVEEIEKIIDGRIELMENQAKTAQAQPG